MVLYPYQKFSEVEVYTLTGDLDCDENIQDLTNSRILTNYKSILERTGGTYPPPPPFPFVAPKLLDRRDSFRIHYW